MLFQAVMKFLSRLVEFKILVNWGMAIINQNPSFQIVEQLLKYGHTKALYISVKDAVKPFCACLHSNCRGTRPLETIGMYISHVPNFLELNL